jgi:hypothetical protein
MPNWGYLVSLYILWVYLVESITGTREIRTISSKIFRAAQ